MAGQRSAKIEAPEEFPDEAWEEPGEGGLTQTQFAARVSAKREQAAQDAGWVKPPGPDAEAEEPIVVPDEPESPEEGEDKPEEGESEEAPTEGEEEEAEEEGEEEPEEEPEAHEEEFYVSRYVDRESAEQGIAEKDATINRLYRELHEQRQAIEQALAEREQGQPQLDAQEWHEWAEEAVGNGAGADGALAALREGGREGYNLYLGHWLDDEDSRADALAFNNEVMLAFAEQRAAIQAEAFREQRSPTEEAQLARQRAASFHEDFDSYSETMDRLVQEPGLLPEETKQFLAELAQSGTDGKVRAWDYLYMAAKAIGQPNRARAKQVERRRRKASADSAKVAAMVSSAEASPTRTPLTEAEQKALAYKNQLRERWDLPPIEE